MCHPRCVYIQLNIGDKISHNTIVFAIYFILSRRHVSDYLSCYLQVIIYIPSEEGIQRKLYNQMDAKEISLKISATHPIVLITLYSFL
jgi:hypothetical protein